MLIWRILAALSAIVLCIFIIIVILKNFFGKMKQIEVYDNSLYETKEYKDKIVNFYKMENSFVTDYLIYESKKKKHLMIRYKDNDRYNYYVFYKLNNKIKKIHINDKEHKGTSEVIDIPKKAKGLNIVENIGFNIYERPKVKRVLVFSILASLSLCATMIISKWISLEFFVQSKLYPYLDSVYNLISNILIIVVPVLFFIVSFLLLLRKCKKGVDNNEVSR